MHLTPAKNPTEDMRWRQTMGELQENCRITQGYKQMLEEVNNLSRVVDSLASANNSIVKTNENLIKPIADEGVLVEKRDEINHNTQELNKGLVPLKKESAQVLNGFSISNIFNRIIQLLTSIIRRMMLIS